MNFEKIRNVAADIVSQIYEEEYEKMPFIRKGKTVYKKSGNKLVKKGSSKTVAGAKDYMKAMYANSRDLRRKR